MIFVEEHLGDYEFQGNQYVNMRAQSNDTSFSSNVGGMEYISMGSSVQFRVVKVSMSEEQRGFLFESFVMT